MDKLRWLDLQMFADKDGVVEADDPTKVDADDLDGDLDDDLEDDLDGEPDFGKLGVDAPDEEDEDTEEDPDEPEEPDTAPTKPKDTPPPGEKLFTKAEIEAMFQDRINRDPYRATGRQLEQKTGMTLQQLNEYADKQQEEEEVKKYADEYMVDEEVARRHVREARENKRYKEELPQMQRQNQVTQGQLNYINDKARDMSNPYVRKYAAEIDAFAQNGQACGFEAAKNYVIGQKVLSGEITDAVKRGTTKKTLADIEKQKRTGLMQGGVGGKSDPHGDVDPFQKQIAAQLGVPLKEVIAERARIQRERTGR